MYRLCILLVLCPSVILAQFSYDYPRYQVDSTGTEVTFECVHNSTPVDTTPDRWVLNDLATIPKGFNDGKLIVSADASNLTIKNIQQKDVGIYHCVLIDMDGNLVLQKVGLNPQGPYFEDMLAKYRNNIIIAFSAGFGFAILAGVICSSYHFSWGKRQAALNKVGIEGANYEMEVKVKPQTPPPTYTDEQNTETNPEANTTQAVVEPGTNGNVNNAFEPEKV